MRISQHIKKYAKKIRYNEKNTKDGRNNNMKLRSLAALMLAFVLCFCLAACKVVDNSDGSSNNSSSNQGNTDMDGPAAKGEVKYKFLKVGKSPCTIIRTQNSTVIIDAASEDQGGDIVTYLNEKAVTTVDYLIVTNFSKTCIGGVPTLLQAAGITVKNIYEPSYAKDSSAYTSYKNALAAVGITPIKIAGDTSITVDDLQIKFLPPLKDYSSALDENDEGNSVALSISHGNARFLYTSRVAGDRVTELISQIGDTKYDFITVPNYGRYDAKYETLFNAISAKNAVIFASAKNPPETSMIQLLDNANIKYYVTRDGGVEASSDGTAFTIKQ